MEDKDYQARNHTYVPSAERIPFGPLTGYYRAKGRYLGASIYGYGKTKDSAENAVYFNAELLRELLHIGAFAHAPHQS